MTVVSPWKGYAVETDPAKIEAAGAQLSRDFEGTSFESTLLSADQQQEYRRWSAGHAAAERRRGATHAVLAKHFADEAHQLEEASTPTVLNLEHDARGPVIAERPGKPATAPTARLSLDEAAQHLHVSPMVAIVELGVFGVLAADDGSFAAADVERLAQDR